MLLEGKTAIVTGTGPNIGGEIARTLAANGANVVCLDIKLDQAKITADQIEKAGGSAIAVQADVSIPTDVENAVRVAVQRYGGVNLLVNNAAISPLGNLFDHDLDSWHRTLDICLSGTLLCSRYAAKQMISQGNGGAIVNISSTSGHRGRTDAIAYATSKGGLLQLTRVMANELAPHKIRVNSVSPTTSGLALATGRPHSEVGPPPGIPLGRWGKTEDQAEAVLFLLSSKADFITGIDLPVDGGLLSSGMFRKVAREKQ
jgi:NAD(P)-dependent dehydrogenase (short-subunit alcohol dehydrogenase family)